MCVKPCPMSQISSSWRRTLRWLRANPPGRSDAASRSLMTQQNARGSRPCAHRPFTPPASISRHAHCSRRCAHLGQEPHRVGRAADVVHAHERAPWSTAHTTVARVPSSRASAAVATEHGPDERLARRADEHGNVDALDQLASASEEHEVVRRGLAEPDPGIGAQRVGSDARGACGLERARPGSRRPR